MSRNTMVTGTIPISSIFVYTLFDTSASHSYLSPPFVSKLGVIIEPLDVELLIDTNTRSEMVTDIVCANLALSRPDPEGRHVATAA